MDEHQPAAENAPPGHSSRQPPDHSPRTRLVACQGTSQLLTAMAAIACREDRAGRDWRGDHNILVIHDLYSPAASDFDRVIREMAAHLANWRSIVTIPAERLRGLKTQVSSRGAEAAIQEVRALIGVDRAESIYLCRNWQFGSELLLNAYRSSEKVCYGDGIGIYSGRRSRSATGPRRLLGRGWKLLLQRSVARMWGARRTQLEPVEFDLACLAGIAAPETNGRPLVSTHRVEAEWQRRAIDQLRGVEFSGLAELRGVIGGRSCLVLLGESLSESGAATLAAEVALYGEIASRLDPRPGTLLLYKPHPRDNPHKVRQISERLSRHANDVLTLNSGAVPFLPFELLFASVLRDAWNRGRVQIWTGGFAAMGLAHLFGASVSYGIGEELIRRHFASPYVAPRIELESYMRRYLAQTALASPLAA